ncbi:MAG: TIGR04255 family protein [Nanoarchaeota archaeon]|nr:TIGR04255 family protein [Nanoarchaeota archaeon]
MGEYKKNFISNIIFRIDFPTILELENKLPSGFQSKIIDLFPILREPSELNINLSVSSGENLNKNQVSVGARTWQFYNKEKTKAVILSKNSLNLEYKNYYSNFKELTSDIKLILKSLFEEYTIEIIDRIGLRYIDEIKLDSGDPLDWKDIICDDLTSSIRFVSSKNLMRTMQEIYIKEDNYTIVFKYGIPNSLYPSKIVRKEFTLDTDCFLEGELSKEDIINLLEEFHEVVKKTFEKSIGNNLRKIMNGEIIDG